MRKYTFLGSLLLALWIFSSFSHAATAIYTFSEQNVLGGESWGTLTISVFESNTLEVSFLGSEEMPYGAQVTGFGFGFDSPPIEVLNPDDPDFPDDQNSLNWVESTNLNAIPQPSNRFEFSSYPTKRDYSFGVTEGNANNFNPPGIMSRELDIFYLLFGDDLFPIGTTDSDLFNFIKLTGIRIQSIPNYMEEGGSFLAGTPVPVPTTLMLLGSGLFGLFFLRRKKSWGSKLECE